MAIPYGGLGGGSSALRYLSQGLIDPEAALRNQVDPDTLEELPGTALSDYYRRLTEKTREGLSGQGMLPSQQLPKMPGWSGDSLEAPETPNLAVQGRSRMQQSLTSSVSSLLGQVPVTTWGTRHGQKPGEYNLSPAAQDSIDMANAPWQLEQERVAAANKAHAFRNQYSYLASQAKTKDQEEILKETGHQATGAAMNEYTAGFRDFAAGQAVQAQENKNRSFGQTDTRLALMKEQGATRAAQNAVRLQLEAERNRIANRRVDLAGEAAVRAKHKQDYGSSADYTNIQHPDGAVAAIDNIVNELDTNPNLTDLSNKTFHLSDIRLAIDDGKGKAEWFDKQRSDLMENMLQLQKRLGTRSGAKFLERELIMLGDNAPISREMLFQMRDRVDMVRWGFENAHPGMAERPTIAPAGQAGTPAQRKAGSNRRTPPAGAGPGGKKIDDMSLDELNTLLQSLSK